MEASADFSLKGHAVKLLESGKKKMFFFTYYKTPLYIFTHSRTGVPLFFYFDRKLNNTALYRKVQIFYSSFTFTVVDIMSFNLIIEF